MKKIFTISKWSKATIMEWHGLLLKISPLKYPNLNGLMILNSSLLVASQFAEFAISVSRVSVLGGAGPHTSISLLIDDSYTCFINGVHLLSSIASLASKNSIKLACSIVLAYRHSSQRLKDSTNLTYLIVVAYRQPSPRSKHSTIETFSVVVAYRQPSPRWQIFSKVTLWIVVA